MIEKYYHKLLGIVLITGLFLSSCSGYGGFDDCHNTITFTNSTSSPIIYFSTLKDGFFNYDPTNEDYAADYKVAAGASKSVKIGISLSCWEQVIKSADGYLYIYVYDANYVETNGWAESKNKFIHKYTLDVKQLNKMGWKVNYK